MAKKEDKKKKTMGLIDLKKIKSQDKKTGSKRKKKGKKKRTEEYSAEEIAQVEAKVRERKLVIKAYEKIRERLESEIEDLRMQIAEKDKVIDKYINEIRRLRSHLEDYKNKSRRDLERVGNERAEKVILEFLDVLDNVDLALKHINNSKDIENVKEGLNMIRKHFINKLRVFGVEIIASKNEKFDPQYHEAVAVITTTEHEDGTILEVEREGYKLGDKVIRAAKVVVAKNPEVEESSKTNEDERVGEEDIGTEDKAEHDETSEDSSVGCNGVVQEKGDSGSIRIIKSRSAKEPGSMDGDTHEDIS